MKVSPEQKSEIEGDLQSLYADCQDLINKVEPLDQRLGGTFSELVDALQSIHMAEQWLDREFDEQEYDERLESSEKPDA